MISRNPHSYGPGAPARPPLTGPALPVMFHLYELSIIPRALREQRDTYTHRDMIAVRAFDAGADLAVDASVHEFEAAPRYEREVHARAPSTR